MIVIISAAAGDGGYHIKCYGGIRGGEAMGFTAAQLIKQSLIGDLMDKVPRRNKEGRQNFCSVLTWNGLRMYGYANCAVVGGNDAACRGCLSIAGNILMGGCQGTGSGQVIGERDLCYVRVGLGGCCHMWQMTWCQQGDNMAAAHVACMED
ncbi:unnamed protein product [Linum trigynum]|uniref:Gnk2-homologous domain-containing protein n=1 Tax=Linum trigynum TaxID=586398 RepID=A0AAV2G436_9ROSI